MGYKAIDTGTNPRSCRAWAARTPGPAGIDKAGIEMLRAGLAIPRGAKLGPAPHVAGAGTRDREGTTSTVARISCQMPGRLLYPCGMGVLSRGGAR